MKSSVSCTPVPEFPPVSITLTFESPTEMNAFGALFNFPPVLEALKSVSGFDAFNQVSLPLRDSAGALLYGSEYRKITEALIERMRHRIGS